MGHAYRSLRRPSHEDLREVAEQFHVDLTGEELNAIESFVDGAFENYERLEELWEPPEVSIYAERRFGCRPGEAEDPLNAVLRDCTVPGAPDGTLAGYEVGLKDNIALAGLEMTCGSRLYEGYVPGHDATVVTRLLDAGATVTAKLNMENMAWSGSGELSAFGPVLNPVNPDYLAGGSSGGSAAAVAEGLVDIAIGTDQGGSVRMPASWCGIVGHKPTFGLVPYTGIASLDPSIDHAGPMARTVEDCARALEVIAGQDALDPRQGTIETDDYVAALNDDTSVTVGVLKEGFDRKESDPAVDGTVREAIDVFADAGANVQDVSVPFHDDARAVLAGIHSGGTVAMTRDDGVGRYGRGFYDVDGAVAFGRARRTNADDLPPMGKLSLVLGGYLTEEYQSRHYAMSQNLLRDLASAYDEALMEVDVLALPTTPHGPHTVDEDASLRELMERSLSMNGNTSPFNGSGHPAVSVPCGTVVGLPVGLMLVGKKFDDAGVLQAAHAFEQAVESDN